MGINDISVGRFKIFYLYSIDLGFLIQNDKSVGHLLDLRSKDEIYLQLINIFAQQNSSAALFENPCLETNKIKIRTNEAIGKGGKNIWSPLFFQRQVPICFQSNQKIVLSPGLKHTIGSYIDFSTNENSENIKIRFDGCDFRIFREGTLSFIYEFSQDSCSTTIRLNDFINILNQIEYETFSGYVFLLGQIIEDWKNPLHKFNSLNLRLTNDENEIRSNIETSTISHSCLFLEKINNIDSTKPYKFITDSEGDCRIPGILNKSTWYEEYSKEYIQEVFKKNIGYRKDEFYLTDKDSSLIILKDYWDENKPSGYYLYDLILAIELQISELAFLCFIQSYMQINPISKKVLSNPSSKKAVRLVIQTRSILTISQEVMEINTIIIHGFTRKFILQLICERNIQETIESIERRIENINSAIELKSSFDIGKKGIKLNKKSINLAIVGFIISSTISLIEFILTYIIPVIKSIIESFIK